MLWLEEFCVEVYAADLFQFPEELTTSCEGSLRKAPA
jgi:hypothetical protein